MADFDETYALTDELKTHWNGLREERGWSWEVLADYFERYCLHDPATPGLLAWARSQAAPAAKSARARTTGTEKAVKK